MKKHTIFVFEWYSSQAVSQTNDTAREGMAMLRALVSDILRLNTFVVHSLVGKSLQNDLPAGVRNWSPGLQVKPYDELKAVAADSDYTLVIAPETDGILESCLAVLHDTSHQLISPDLSFVQLTADKRQTARVLSEAGIPTIAEMPRSVDSPRDDVHDSFIIKPNRGAGAEATYLIRSQQQLEKMRLPVITSSDWIWQPFHPGIPASINVITGQRTLLLPPTRQLFTPPSDDGKLGSYRAAEVIDDPSLIRRARSLANQVIAALPETRGFWGIDMILDPSMPVPEDRSQPNDVLVEVNPRLTSSYVHLRPRLRYNIAQKMIEIICEPNPKTFH